MKRPRNAVAFAAVAVALAIGYGLFGGGFSFDFDLPRREPMNYDDAVAKLERVVGDVDWREQNVGRVTAATFQRRTLEDTLPEIGSFPIVATPVGGGGVTAEIFASTEKSGSGTDGWIVEAAGAFNEKNVRLSNGQRAGIRIRKIASGTGYQFIASRKYLPDGFTPSNHLWIRMAKARGITMTPIREKTVGNVAGIVMRSDKAEVLRAELGTISVSGIVEAAIRGRLVTGYTDPFASSTGLNFLVTVLATFSGGDEARMLAPEVTSAFEEFQRRIPFVALTTLQMRESVRRDGSLDAFVMEYQTYVKTRELSSGYEFIPFGVLHENPLYAVGEVDPLKHEAMEAFAEFLDTAPYRRLARDYGFDPELGYEPPIDVPKGETVITAQRIWKEKKDAGRPISAVFLCDTSGSMQGSRLNSLKRALIEGSSFVSEDNAIGLVQFSNNVRILLPIRPFQGLHKSAFVTTVERMQADGHTAMYDGIAVALRMLVQEKVKNPDVRPMLFVLTDGETNRGIKFGDMERIIEGIRIPVYTIGFEADIKELGRLSGLVEAASLNAGEENIRYQIGSLLNSQM